MSKDKIIAIFHESDKFIITCHLNADGDAIGAVNGLGLFLEELGKDVKIIYPEEIPEKYKFLPRPKNTEIDEEIVQGDKEIFEKSRAMIVLDSSNKERVESVIDRIWYDCLINIDHHPTNTMFGEINLVEPDKSATCQVLFDLFEAINENKGTKLNCDISTNLYAGILTDTGCFKFENTDNKTFETASKLLNYGVKSHIVAREIYESMPLKTFYFIRTLLNTLKISEDYKIAWLSCKKDLLLEYDIGADELEGAINYPKNLKPVEFAVLFKETDEGYTKVGMRSKTLDVSKVALEYDGGGHKRAAGCLLKLSLEEAKREIINRLQIELKGAM